MQVDVSRTGLGDGVASILVFLAGAPAMTPAQYRDWKRKTIIGFNLRIKIPIGQYDETKLINLGSNRWQVVPALAISHRIGKFTAEGYVGAWFSSDNKSAFGGNVLSQAPLFAFQLNASYSFKPRLWLSLAARQTAGGKTSVNGVDHDNPTENTRIGLVFGVPIARQHTVRLVATTGARTTAGGDWNTLALQWFYAW